MVGKVQQHGWQVSVMRRLRQVTSKRPGRQPTVGWEWSLDQLQVTVGGGPTEMERRDADSVEVVVEVVVEFVEGVEDGRHVGWGSAPPSQPLGPVPLYQAYHVLVE